MKTYNIPNTKFMIQIDESNMDKYKSLLNSIDDSQLSQLNMTQLSDLFKYYLKLSNINEKDYSIREETINKIDMYLSKECDIPKITELYSLLFGNIKCYRTPEDTLNGFVGVGKRNNKWIEEFYNIGMKASDINSEELQNLVNYYYQIQKTSFDVDIFGFIFYLLYERIHPHHDDNGRIGRLLFLENVHNHIYYPLSEIINKLRQPELIQNIYDKVNFKYIHNKSEGDNIKYVNSEDYYKIFVDDKLLRNIFKCLCICKEFKVLYFVFRNAKKKNAIVTKLLRAKNLNDDKVENIINDDDLFDEFNKSGFNVENHNKIMSL